MRIQNSLSKILVVGGSVALLAGCDLLTDSKESAPAGDTSWEQSTDLNQEYGGFTFTDESEAFGDPAMSALEAEETSLPVADPDTVASDSTFALRLLWGQLAGNRDAATEVDWSGTVSVSRGGIAVLRTLAFEPRQDHLVRRENRQTVGFVSRTQPSYDGLLLVVHDVPGDNATTLTFATGPYTNTWTLEELKTANLVIPVDDLGNAVSLTGRALRDRPCPSGFVRGHWAQREADRGFFRGVWMAGDAHPIGHVRGHYGVNEAGERVWFGKILGRGGRLIGLARGSWQPSEDAANPGGTFQGQWMARPGERTGAVAGHYLPGREGERGAAGFFEGRWHADCGGGTEQ